MLASPSKTKKAQNAEPKPQVAQPSPASVPEGASIGYTIEAYARAAQGLNLPIVTAPAVDFTNALTAHHPMTTITCNCYSTVAEGTDIPGERLLLLVVWNVP